MDRQTIEAAERVTAWSRARALAAVLETPAMNASTDAVQAGEAPLHEPNEAVLHYLGEQEPAAEDER